MATESFMLNQEMKRRRAMVLSLVGGVIVSTLAFSNDRALFSQATASAETPPVAYAFAPPAEGVGIGGLARSPGAARNFVTPRRAGTTGTPAGLGQPDAPVAFAVQTPGDAPAAATPAASSFAAPGAAPAATGGGQQFAGNPDFGGSNGGVGGSSAAAPTDPTTPPTTPPGTTDPTTPPGTTDPTTPPGTTDPTTPTVPTDPTTPTDPGTPGSVSPVPEPATWLMMIVGFGFVGAMLRRGRRPVRGEAVRAETVSAAKTAS